jgi:integrase/recombinase XerD
MAPQALRPEHVMLVKADCLKRNLSEARIASLVFALRSFLKFCRLRLGLETMNPKEIRPPRLPKREVLYLTPEEVEEFVAAIPIKKNARVFNLRWLCFRALVEVMLGTGMRMAEALSLKRSAINFQTGECSIIGKGGKERVVYFSIRSLGWLKEYLTRRRDSGKPLTRATAVTWFKRFRKLAGIKKRVSSHVLRHSFATTLLFNGCPIGHIKELLGHENLVTTCRFYLACDRKAAKNAHAKYLDYEPKSD